MEINRLRDARDQLAAEVNERRISDSAKNASQAEFKRLTLSQHVRLSSEYSSRPKLTIRQERITILENQLMRLRSQLAAHTGHAGLTSHLLQREDGSEYLHQLEEQLQ